MQRFNLALVPADKKFQDLFTSLAQNYFRSLQDGYILGKKGLAHVTLCQFHAENEQIALEALQALADKRNKNLYITEFYSHAGTAEHSNFFWAGFLIKKEPALLDIQRNCFSHLSDRKLGVFTPIESYSPHMTLARLAKNPGDDFHFTEEVPYGQEIAFRIVVGYSTKNGVLTQEL